MKSKNGNRKYVHKACVVMTIGNPTNYVIKKYMLKPSKDNEKDKNIDNQEKELEKSEGEVTALKAIVSDLPKWIDVVANILIVEFKIKTNTNTIFNAKSFLKQTPP